VKATQVLDICLNFKKEYTSDFWLSRILPYVSVVGAYVNKVTNKIIFRQKEYSVNEKNLK
jgi:hypothetical protein